MDWYEPLESISGIEDHDEDAWIAAGFAALERYLARHAAFDAWCADHLRRYGSEPGRDGERRRARVALGQTAQPAAAGAGSVSPSSASIHVMSRVGSTNEHRTTVSAASRSHATTRP